MTHLLSLTFDLAIDPQDIYSFRGAFIDMVRKSPHISDEVKELFSNKIDDGDKGKPKQTYPMIQYRCEDGLAQVWAINEGARAMQHVIKYGLIDNFCIEGHTLPLVIVKTLEKELQDAVVEDEICHHYHVKQLLPFNKIKQTAYKEELSYINKVKLIEQLILNELVLLTYALKIDNSKRIQVEITDILSRSKAPYRTKDDNERLTVDEYVFNLKFRTNINLPENISIGRHKAYGYGILQVIE